MRLLPRAVTVPPRTAVARLGLATVTGVGAAATAVGLGATSAWLIARAAQQPPVLYLMVAIVAVRAFGIGRGVLRYLERLASHDAALRMLARLRERTYKRLCRATPTGLRSGDLAARVVSDVDALIDLWPRLGLPYVTAAVIGTGTVVLIWTILPSAALVLAVSLLVVALVAPWLAIRTSRRASQRLAPLRGQLTTSILDTLRGSAELLAYGATQAQLEQVTAADRAVTAAERRGAFGLGLGSGLAALAAGAAVWGALVLGIHAGLDTVALTVIALTPLAAHEIFAGLPAAASHLPRIQSAAERVTALWQAPDADTSDTPSQDAAPTGATAPVPAWPFGVRVRGLRARWPAPVAWQWDTDEALGPTEPAREVGDPGREVLTGVDLEVPPGARVALMGPSGAGKSTLAAVLLRFLTPTGGSVTLVPQDGPEVDLARLDPEAVRRLIGLCAQDTYLFDTTIAENIRLARPGATDEQIWEVLDRARLGDWVRSLPHGLDTHVGEHGARLSGGQRQRIGLARVLLADFPFVILDEPTEHLDEATATALLDDLLSATTGRSVLLITHRPLRPGQVDRVVRLNATGSTDPDSVVEVTDTATPTAAMHAQADFVTACKIA